MNLGDKIKLIRYKHDMSQDELACVLDINRNYLSRIETNKSYPTMEVLIKLAKYFNISVDNLLGINLDKVDSESKKEKIDKINKMCFVLSDKDLDFIIRLLSIMNNDL